MKGSKLYGNLSLLLTSDGAKLTSSVTQLPFWKWNSQCSTRDPLIAAFQDASVRSKSLGRMLSRHSERGFSRG